MAHALNEAALRKWMQSLGPRLIALSAGICRDRHRAEEIVQEAFIKLWSSPPDGGEVVYPAWMRRVVTNLSINALQRTRRPQALPEFSTDAAVMSHDRPEDIGEQREGVDRVHRALDLLDPEKRALLMLRAQEQLTYEQIATHLDVPIGTVMSRLNRARTALAEALKQIDQAGTDPVEDDGREEASVFRFRNYRQA